MRNRFLELCVGIFIIVALSGLLFLAFKVSGLTQLGDNHYYILKADFDNIGGLKVRAPVAVSGVKIGRVVSIKLNRQTYRAEVIMQIEDSFNDMPVDTSASILTQGILGSNYVSLTPGYNQQMLKPNGRIETTHSALILENLIGQLMFNLTNNKKDGNESESAAPKPPITNN